MNSMRERNENWREAFESGLSQNDIRTIRAIENQNFDELDEVCLKFKTMNEANEIGKLLR